MFKRDTSRGTVVSSIVVFLLAAVILTACGASESSPEDGDGPAESPPAAVVKAGDALAAELGVETDDVTI